MNRKKINNLIKALLFVCLLFIVSIVIIVFGRKKMEEMDASIRDLQMEIESNKQVVYIVKDKRIKKGETISAGDETGENANVMKQEIYSGLEPDYYITEEDLGCTAIIDLEPQTPVMKNMVRPESISHDTREYEIGAVNLMADQSVNDYIDVRIMFPNGDDYLVLSKKRIIKQALDTNLIFTYMNEEEILRYSSAMVDAYTTTGAYLYTTRYVEFNIQNEAVPNYPVKSNIIDLMVSDPNITSVAQTTLNLEARENLNKKLSALTAEELAAMAEGHGIQDTAKTSVLRDQENFIIEGEDSYDYGSANNEDAEEKVIPDENEDDFDMYEDLEQKTGPSPSASPSTAPNASPSISPTASPSASPAN